MTDVTSLGTRIWGQFRIAAARRCGKALKRAHNNLSPATIDPYRPSNNLSAATEPYRTYDNLCQTIISPYRACNDLSATTDP